MLFFKIAFGVGGLTLLYLLVGICTVPFLHKGPFDMPFMPFTFVLVLTLMFFTVLGLIKY